MKHIFKYFRGYRKQMIAAPIFKFVETITDIVIPLLVANMIDIGVSQHDLKYIFTFGGIVLGLNAELDKVGTATLNNRITHDVSRIDATIGTFLRTIMRTPFLVIGSAIMAMIIDIKLSLLFLVIAPLILLAVFIILKKTGPLYDRTQKNLDRVSEITRENLQGARVVICVSLL